MLTPLANTPPSSTGEIGATSVRALPSYASTFGDELAGRDVISVSLDSASVGAFAEESEHNRRFQFEY